MMMASILATLGVIFSLKSHAMEDISMNIFINSSHSPPMNRMLGEINEIICDTVFGSRTDCSDDYFYASCDATYFWTEGSNNWVSSLSFSPIGVPGAGGGMNGGGYSWNNYITNTWVQCANNNCLFADVFGSVTVTGSNVRCLIQYDATVYTSTATCPGLNCRNPFHPTSLPTITPSTKPTPIPTIEPTTKPTKPPTPIPQSRNGCGEVNNCMSCALSATLNGACQWCNLDNHCHEHQSESNPCSRFESISGNPALCKDSCSQQTLEGVGPSACAWYSTKTNSIDPMKWAGGDFLPRNYIHAAHCACSGCGNLSVTQGCHDYWDLNPGIEKCVRREILLQHQLIDSSKRQDFKSCTWPCYEFGSLVYEIHETAYRNCGCSGTIAPLQTWQLIFFSGAIVPCKAIIPSILYFGRCGCGW